MSPGESTREFYRRQGDQRALLTALQQIIQEMSVVAGGISASDLSDIGKLAGLTRAAQIVEGLRSK